jgi:glycosyltransferase involved in cell wall biosynthesis
VKAALAHDWLVEPGGSESVLREFLALFPAAPLYVLFWRPDRWRDTVGSRPVFASFLQRFPHISKYYRFLLAFFPRAAESLSVSRGPYDLVVSSSHAAIKGLIPPPGAVHICYCYTPMRYVWDLEPVYLAQVPRVFRGYARRVFARLRDWEVLSAARVTKFIAISRFVGRRIRAHLKRDAIVIYPPADLEFFRLPSAPPSREAYLVVSRFVPNKNLETAINVAAMTGEPFDIVGTGPLEARLKAMGPPNVRFRGRVSREELRGLYQNARALVFLSVEDFGLASVEAQACGTPVVTGPEGALPETVAPGVTGVVAPSLEPSAVAAALRDAASLRTTPETFRDHARSFSRSRFYDNFRRVLAEYGFTV